MSDFVEIADRVWVARHEWFDLNITVVGGERGLVVVDTHASDRAAGEVVDGVRSLAAGRPPRSQAVVAGVNTHEHFDHTFGNARLRRELGDVPVHAHEEAAARTVAAGEGVKALYAADDGGADGRPDEHRDEVLATPIEPATHTFSSAAVIDLGDRHVELVHLGRGHTAGDVVVAVPDAGVLAAGDLVEETGSRGVQGDVPGLGQDCWPFEWPATLDLVAGMLTPASRVVPGHGAVVDRDFVVTQRADLGVVAETIRDLAGRGVAPDEALAAGEWPYPRSALAHAVRRGYEQLPRSARSLPLI